MKTPRKQNLIAAALGGALALTTPVARAAEIGHYAGGLLNIRDYAMPPEPGFYGAAYNYFYSTDRINDRNGDETKSYTYRANRLPGKPSVTVKVDPNVDIYVLAPSLMWVSDWKPLGARYAALISPSFANASLGAALSTETKVGGSIDHNHFGVGDMLIQPLWLDWGFKHFDVTLGYGVYAPIGNYDTQVKTLPGIGPIRVDSVDNIGYGFWTHQIQSAGTWYPWADKRMAVMGGLTYEIHHEKEDYDLTPGQNLTFNWGISQLLPLTKKLLLEVGPAGYSSWQITDDEGKDANNGTVHDEVHAAGGQLGLTYVPWMLSVNGHYFYEFASKDRFQGQAFGISIAKKF